MKLTQDEISKLKKPEADPAMMAIANSIAKLVEKPTGVNKILEQQERAIAAIISKIPEPVTPDYQKLAQAIAAAIPLPQTVTLPNQQQGDEGVKQMAAAILRLAIAIEQKGSSEMDIQRKSTGEIHRVIVKPYKG